MDIKSVEKAKAGDKEALLDLITHKKQELYRLAYVYTNSPEDAMDAMEDMIVILYRQIGSLRSSEQFYSWCKTILVNCCKRIQRKRRKTVELGEATAVITEHGYEALENKSDIISALKTLNEGQQEAIRLRYFMDMDYQSIAKLTRAPLGTVKSRVFNGLKRLRNCLGGEYR